MTDNQQANQERTPTRTKQLVRLIEQSGIEFFKDSHEGHAYLNVQKGNVFHTWSVDSADFKAHIRDLYESEFDDIASSSMIHETQRRFIDMAIDMEDHPVHVRSAWSSPEHLHRSWRFTKTVHPYLARGLVCDSTVCQNTTLSSPLLNYPAAYS